MGVSINHKPLIHDKEKYVMLIYNNESSHFILLRSNLLFHQFKIYIREKIYLSSIVSFSKMTESIKFPTFHRKL